MNKSILDTLEELDKAATPGPWCCNIYSGEFYLTIPTPSFTNELPTDKDLELIETVRNALPALLAVARAAGKLVNRYDGALPSFYLSVEGEEELSEALAALEKTK
jgi:hypothetical protein